MRELSIYLAGRVKGLDDEGKGWRKDIAEKLEAVAGWCDARVDVFDPTKYFSYSESKHHSNKQVKDYYFSRIRKCDLVVLNCDDTNYSIGTAQEVQFAVDNHIPVIGFGTKEMYPWIIEADCQVVFNSVHEAVDYIRDYYLG